MCVFINADRKEYNPLLKKKKLSTGARGTVIYKL